MDELLTTNTPIRFQELWKKCEGKMSKISFVKTLGQLSAEGTLIREQRGRKHVTFRPNPRLPEYKAMRTVEKVAGDMMNEALKGYRQSAADSKNILLAAKNQWQKEEAIAHFTGLHANLLAMEAVTYTFWEAATTKGREMPRLENIVSKAVEKYRLEVRRTFVEMIKADRQEAEKSFAAWLEQLGLDMEDAIQRAVGFSKRLRTQEAERAASASEAR